MRRCFYLLALVDTAVRTPHAAASSVEAEQQVIGEACPAECRECQLDEACSAALSESIETGTPQGAETIPVFGALVNCLGAQAQAGELGDPDGLDTEHTAEVAADIACDMCGFVVEDMWSTLVQESLTGSARAKAGPKKMVRGFIRTMCAAGSPILDQFLGLFNIQECPKGMNGLTECKGKQKWQIVKDDGQEQWRNSKGDPTLRVHEEEKEYDKRIKQRMQEEERAWQLAAHEALCSQYFNVLDTDLAIDISQQLALHLPALNESYVAAESEAQQQEVIVRAVATQKASVVEVVCAAMCSDEPLPTTTKKKKKKQKKKRKDTIDKPVDPRLRDPVRGTYM